MVTHTVTQGFHQAKVTHDIGSNYRNALLTTFASGRALIVWDFCILFSSVQKKLLFHCGGANLTKNSRRNGETMLKLTGPIVSEVLKDLRDARSLGEVWHGK